MTEHLTDKQRERLLTPCECGHTINDHGSLVACWRCEDEDGDCSTPFETLLAARIEALLAEARAEGARAGAKIVLDALAHRLDHWDAQPWDGEVSSDDILDYCERALAAAAAAEQTGGAS